MGGRNLFPKGGIPTAQQVKQQVKVSLFAIPIYSLLPTLAEMAVEKGWTVAYADLTAYSTPAYLVLFAVYVAFVEWCVYWMHRLLHDIRPAYFALHATHHIYNDNNSLSPMAGLAFDPIDGVMQGFPYALLLFFVPMHMMTFELLFSPLASGPPTSMTAWTAAATLSWGQLTTPSTTRATSTTTATTLSTATRSWAPSWCRRDRRRKRPQLHRAVHVGQGGWGSCNKVWGKQRALHAPLFVLSFSLAVFSLRIYYHYLLSFV